jgi:hypothetical protein
MERKYDLDERCVEFGAASCSTRIECQSRRLGCIGESNCFEVARLRHCTTARSRVRNRTADFIHKMKLALKELRESRNNLRVQFKAKLMDPEIKENAWLLRECVELVAIFAASVKTAERNREKKK